MVSKWIKPVQYPAEYFAHLNDEEMDFLAATSMRGLEERLKAAGENNDAEELWEIPNETGE
eukprot:8410867-Alexandrium_andersonii.AAC.1